MREGYEKEGDAGLGSADLLAETGEEAGGDLSQLPKRRREKATVSIRSR